MITYEPIGANNSLSLRNEVNVLLDGKRVGQIRQIAGGWHYRPKNGQPGATFATAIEVRKSLERDGSE